MDSLIRWKRGDYIRLSRAVSRFNKIINELDIDEREYLPDLRDYQDLKKHITSRKELNRVINSLKRANSENLLAKKVYSSGEEVSRWEYAEINKAMRRAYRNLALEKESILKERPSIGMGDERLSEIASIEKSFMNLNERSGRDFSRIVSRIYHLGRSDYKISRDELFRQNFYKALEGISNFQNYDILKAELDKIKNPTKFYEYVKQSTILMDLFLWYKNPEVNVYGSFGKNQDALNFAMIYDLEIEETKV